MGAVDGTWGWGEGGGREFAGNPGIAGSAVCAFMCTPAPAPAVTVCGTASKKTWPFTTLNQRQIHLQPFPHATLHQAYSLIDALHHN